MTTLDVKVTVNLGSKILAPAGIATPNRAVTGLTVIGGQVEAVLNEAELGIVALLIVPEADVVTLRYAIKDCAALGPYPEVAFSPRETAYTCAARELADASREIALQAGGGRAGIEALVAEAEARFRYGHPDARFTDGHDAVPYLSCGLTEGSCVDINTYLIASLRAAGYDAAYFYGYFFPKERAGMTDDGHCWVVTRHAGEVLAWDIAHHIKAGLGPTRPGLNPRPGQRIAMTHSMGHRYHHGGQTIDLKLLGTPVGVRADQAPSDLDLEARLAAAPTPEQHKVEVFG